MAAELTDTFLRNERSLLNTARQQLDALQTAEDLVQETYLRSLQAIHAGTVIENCRGWLFQVLRNLITDHHRKYKRISNKSVDMFDELQDNGDAQQPGRYEPSHYQHQAQTPPTLRYNDPTDIDTLYSKEVFAVVLSRVMPVLTPNQRHYLELIFVQDLSLPEIAALEGCPDPGPEQDRAINRIKALRHRGLTTIREYLTHLGYDVDGMAGE